VLGRITSFTLTSHVGLENSAPPRLLVDFSPGPFMPNPMHSLATHPARGDRTGVSFAISCPSAYLYRLVPLSGLP